MNTIKSSTVKAITFLLLPLLLVILLLCNSRGVVYASADTGSSGFSDVVADLSQDPKFNVNDYKYNASDYSLKLIQLAESSDKELLLYVYQPSANDDAKAVAVSISEQANNAENFEAHLYELEFLSSNGVFYKYRVKDYALSAASERYYNVIMLQRNIIKGIDAESSDVETNRKAYSVGQYWSVVRQNNTVKYSMLEYETVIIENPFVSAIRVKLDEDGTYEQTTTTLYQDNYFIAFSTNRNMQKLISATVSHRIQDYLYTATRWMGQEDDENSKRTEYYHERKVEKDVYANETNKISQIGFKVLWWDKNKTYTWDRIQSAAKFTESSGANQRDLDVIADNGLQWVLMFDEVSVTHIERGEIGRHEIKESGQYIDQVTILRLEFVEDGVTYNLGTVSNTVTSVVIKPGANSGNNTEKDTRNWFQKLWDFIMGLPDFLKYPILVILGILAALILIPVIKLVVILIKSIVSLFKLIFKKNKEK